MKNTKRERGDPSEEWATTTTTRERAPLQQEDEEEATPAAHTHTLAWIRETPTTTTTDFSRSFILNLRSLIWDPRSFVWKLRSSIFMYPHT